eukprot:gnl/Trimastix_PCT/1578.p1 GENE.gnl/Trimastix_PCT/1578~~gnl/Trimastix_PCT/1578.p1  ORF type:complete len:336 (-),score=60.04 gnl/Trimastix_PCT/1578:43-1050(-)
MNWKTAGYLSGILVLWGIFIYTGLIFLSWVAPGFKPDSIIPPMIFTVFYVWLVYYGIEHRNDPDTKRRAPLCMMVLYNAFQVIFSFTCFALVILSFWHPTAPMTKFFGNSFDIWQLNPYIRNAVLIHYISKYIDAIDTILIVYNQKSKTQLHFLHCFHHFSITWGYWVVNAYKNPDVYLAVGFNAFVHFIMYGYYLSTSLKFKVPLWFKKSLTTFQQIQFTCIAFQSLAYFWYNGFDVAVFYQLCMALAMLGMFASWRVKAYQKRAARTKAAQEKTDATTAPATTVDIPKETPFISGPSGTESSGPASAVAVVTPKSLASLEPIKEKMDDAHMAA